MQRLTDRHLFPVYIWKYNDPPCYTISDGQACDISSLDRQLVELDTAVYAQGIDRVTQLILAGTVRQYTQYIGSAPHYCFDNYENRELITRLVLANANAFYEFPLPESLKQNQEPEPDERLYDGSAAEFFDQRYILRDLCSELLLSQLNNYYLGSAPRDVAALVFSYVFELDAYFCLYCLVNFQTNETDTRDYTSSGVSLDSRKRIAIDNANAVKRRA